MADESGGIAQIAEAFARVVQDPGAPQKIEADARGFLREAMNSADAEATNEAGAQRMLVYRALIRRGLASAVRAQLPETARRAGPRLDTWITRWIDAELPSSRYLRDVAGEFVAWAAPAWENDAEMPPWMGDFARHEVATFEVRAALGGGEKGGPLELDAPLRFEGSARIVRHAWAVHRALEGAVEAPAKEATALLLYRDSEHEVRRLSLSPLAAEILARLFEGQTLRAAIAGGCAAIGEALDDAVLRGTAEVLADLGERGVLLGAAEGRAS